MTVIMAMEVMQSFQGTTGHDHGDGGNAVCNTVLNESVVMIMVMEIMHSVLQCVKWVGGHDHGDEDMHSVSGHNMVMEIMHSVT